MRIMENNMNEKEANNARSYWNDVLHDEFKGESDRACVILATALLDTALENLLRTYMAPCPSNRDPLFDGANAPLATFSSRIDIAYRLGLVSSTFCRDLHLIRRIRNNFAHDVSGCAFEDSSVRDRVQELAKSSKCNLLDSTWRDLFPDSPKGNFKFIVGWMQWLVRGLTEKVKSIEHAEEEWGYKGDWGSLTKDVLKEA